MPRAKLSGIRPLDTRVSQEAGRMLDAEVTERLNTNPLVRHGQCSVISDALLFDLGSGPPARMVPEEGPVANLRRLSAGVSVEAWNLLTAELDRRCQAEPFVRHTLGSVLSQALLAYLGVKKSKRRLVRTA
jgi:hypothetical protein